MTEIADRQVVTDVSLEKWPNVLVVDDDKRIRSLLFRFLWENKIFAVTAADVKDARQMLSLFVFDALILDVMMPGESGLDFISELTDLKEHQAHSQVPVLMLTALGESEDRIKGLELGADDYLPKPFEPRELLLRLQSIMRRHPGSALIVDRTDENIIGGWTYDTVTYELKDMDTGRVIDLSVSEGTLLETLMLQPNRALSRADLALAIGGEMSERAIDVQVTRLRRKLEQDGGPGRLVYTVRGKGYMLRKQKA